MQSKWLLGGDIPQTDFDQRAVTLIHRGPISGYTAPRDSVVGRKDVGMKELDRVRFVNGYCRRFCSS